jgi:hypothetical protein
MLEDKIKKYKSINKFNIDSMLMLKNKIKNKREREREIVNGLLPKLYHVPKPFNDILKSNPLTLKLKLKWPLKP